MELNLQNQKVLVSASSGGIGYAIATAFAKEGAEVIINGRSDKSVDRAIAEIKEKVPDAKLLSLAADLGTADGCQLAIKTYPEVNILVNNLSLYESVDFFEITDEQWQRLFNINIMSSVRLSRHYLKQMLQKSQGRILFIASESAISPAPEMAHYSATKTMQLAIARSLAELTKGTEVTVNSLLPGSTRTESVKKFIQDVFDDESLSAEAAEEKFMVENRPSSLIQRLILPEEIANAAVFLCSPLASAFNGAAVRADGGLIRSVF
ncbi:MAG: SDR family oxidoreductase [Oscillatoria sp. PMC 1068.18]|nr:SDR family oxidoreductase [Oscillatoria sp. PMC 1076.18]MEC4989351.1 SDR family oxidoreductase [Oscillatoria sp. PMC 1068.18]